MTKDNAEMAITKRRLVCGGKAGTEDYDEGYILEVFMPFARVAWKNGTTTDQRVKDLHFPSNHLRYPERA